jgi:adiponectin receptor
VAGSGTGGGTGSAGRTPGRSASPPAAAGPRIATFNELAGTEWEHLADNEHIVRGYRVGHGTFASAVASLFAVHNETVNVWTHLLAAGFFAALLIRVATGAAGELELGLGRGLGKAGGAALGAAAAVAAALPGGHHDLGGGGADAGGGPAGPAGSPGAGAPPPVWPIAVFILSAIVCLAASTAFHLLHVVSRATFTALARADYTGIAVLIAGSNVPCIVYGFWCDPPAMAFFLVLQVVLCGAAAALGLLDAFATKEWRARRAAVFVATGAAGALPALQLYAAAGDAHADVQAVMAGLVVMGAQYIGGALLYGLRLPERWAPGVFDFIGASHGIFHVLVWTAAATHYGTVVTLFRWRADHAACGL